MVLPGAAPAAGLGAEAEASLLQGGAGVAGHLLAGGEVVTAEDLPDQGQAGQGQLQLGQGEALGGPQVVHLEGGWWRG